MGEWELTLDGARVQAGKLPPLKIGPGQSLEVTLDLKRAQETGPGERFLNFHFYQRRDTLWAKAGHEVGWQQFVLPPIKTRKSKRDLEGLPDLRGLEADENDQVITLRAGNVRAVFDKATGALAEFGADKNLIVRGPLLNVWRAATDNDGIKLMLDSQGNKPLARWLALGLNAVKHSLSRIRLVRVQGLPVVEVIHHASGRVRWRDFQHVHRYMLLPSGELQIENTVRIGDGITDIPRVGVNLILTPGLENLEWFGRGPWENYSDRKASARVGRYRSTVTEQYVPYIMPQEHGHKTDVRWLALADAEGQGVRVLGSPTLEFSTSHFTDNDLYNARHTFELKPRDKVILSLDHAQRGLGTASCGPDALEQYRLLESEYSFVYRLRLLSKEVI
jgi:beta-galactosidase